MDELIGSSLGGIGFRMTSFEVKRSDVSEESQAEERRAKDFVKVNRVRVRSSLGSAQLSG